MISESFSSPNLAISQDVSRPTFSGILKTTSSSSQLQPPCTFTPLTLSACTKNTLCLFFCPW